MCQSKNYFVLLLAFCLTNISSVYLISQESTIPATTPVDIYKNNVRIKPNALCHYTTANNSLTCTSSFSKPVTLTNITVQEGSFEERPWYKYANYIGIITPPPTLGQAPRSQKNFVACEGPCILLKKTPSS